ncbi:MAG: DUF4956 domain-containing protein [Paludibacter sp.]|nr:DUF4956 domain-containing protein [Paludibacter sp.]
MMLSTVIDSVINADITTNELPDVTSWEENFRFLGIKLINSADFAELLIRFSLNTLLIFIVVHFMYAKNSKRKDFYFSYLSIGVIVFLLSFLLNNVKLELGFALGLFAIFGIIRYRTDAIPIKEMTYLFIVIGISVINALANKKVSYAELLFTNSAIIFGLWLLEKRLMIKQEASIELIYEKIENIQDENDEILLADIRKRTGKNIQRYEIKKVDFLKDVVHITLFYSVKEKN